MELSMRFSFKNNREWDKSKYECTGEIGRSYIEKMLYVNKYWYEHVNRNYKCVINNFIL